LADGQRTSLLGSQLGPRGTSGGEGENRKRWGDGRAAPTEVTGEQNRTPMEKDGLARRGFAMENGRTRGAGGAGRGIGFRPADFCTTERARGFADATQKNGNVRGGGEGNVCKRGERGKKKKKKLNRVGLTEGLIRKLAINWNDKSQVQRGRGGVLRGEGKEKRYSKKKQPKKKQRTDE